MKGIGIVIWYLLVIFGWRQAEAQPASARPFKTLTVADGLPQSFISGLAQDSAGFVWISTRDGLARYDGRTFKVFRHVPGDSTTLSNNIINGLFLDGRDRLWIAYETGELDLLDTRTENLLHLTADRFFQPLSTMVKWSYSLRQASDGNIWIMTAGGVYICNPDKSVLKFRSLSALGLDSIVGIAAGKDGMILVTDTALAQLDNAGKTLRTIPFTFPNPHVTKGEHQGIFICPMQRANGEIVLHDDQRLIVYKPATSSFAVFQLPIRTLFNNNMLQDSSGQVYFDVNTDIDVLTPYDQVKPCMAGQGSPKYGFKSMLLDRSGVLWLGSNGSGIQMLDLRLPRLTPSAYESIFHEEILKKYLHVPSSEIDKTFLHKMNAYLFRWTSDSSGKTWFAKADVSPVGTPPVCYYRDGRLVQPGWHYTDTVSTNHVHINTITVSPAGKLWGFDFFMRPVCFDTVTRAVTVYPPIADINLDYTYSANSIVMEGEDNFWITTSLNGLYFYNRATGKVNHYVHGETKGALPTNQLMNLLADPGDPNMLWIASLGGGLVKFDKTKGTCIFYTTKQGLPNNTVYAIVPDKRGIFWCSSNKGIFSFDPHAGKVLQSFTSKDGLPGDEFNRYHFFTLPDNRIVFGGVDGYIVFDPSTLSRDKLQPYVALTGIQINNVPSDFGDGGSSFSRAINSLDTITVGYRQGFLTFQFAALEYNIPEKLQYRYRLVGLDKDWVYAGNKTEAVYTKLTPGHYQLEINATNTAGDWSSHIKRLSVVIKPPFWQTWWFIVLLFLIAAGILYFAIQYRINMIRKEMQQKLYFRREASELRAQALRAQMNPHFVFNCLNSIKALIQEDKKKEAVIYLTTFSKLIRSQLNSAEQDVSLHDELETCKLYTQLEALRFEGKIVAEFHVEENIDTFSLRIPPLLLQPFIENAIWHGILPKQNGKVTVSVTREEVGIRCLIDDNGIGREMAMRNKSKTSSTYESKGMNLVRNRLNLFNSLNNQGGTIEVIDKKDQHGDAAGTLVVITFKQQEQ